MSKEADWRDHLGEPDTKLAGLQIWIHGRQFPDSDDYWDGNWLFVTAHCGAQAASVWTSGPQIHLSELETWRSESRRMAEASEGDAELRCIEPGLSVSLQAKTLGHIAMTVDITPNHLNQEHRFQFEIDQTYLQPLIRELSRILESYPVRGEPTASRSNHRLCGLLLDLITRLRRLVRVAAIKKP